VKRRWLDLSKLAEPEAKERITNSADLLRTIEIESARVLSTILKMPQRPSGR
jgi:hypothetical protein